MKTIFSVSIIAAITACFSASASAQQPQCDKDCLRTVRGILKASYMGASISWLDKGNDRLGDKIGVAVLKIYPGKSLYKPDNIRTFLPVIQEAFSYPEVIEDARDKYPIVTVALLRKLQRQVKDHFLNMDITRTLNAVMFDTGRMKAVPAAKDLR